jgi:hypothetical protein
MSLADIHVRAERFQSRIRVRNWIEYAAGAVVIVAFTAMALEAPNWGVRAGTGLIILGVFIIAWNLATLAGAARRDEGMAWADFHRAELVRQRDALRSVWRWYLAPVVPGLAVFIAASAFSTGLPLAGGLVVTLLGFAWIGAVFAAIAWINARAARRLDAEIAALDRARAG